MPRAHFRFMPPRSLILLTIFLTNKTVRQHRRVLTS